jgi:sensor domain CHASE-containing protein
MFLSLALLTVVVERLVMRPAFESLERTRAERDLARTMDALQRDIDLLDNQVNDWAAWDESYQFVADRNQKFIDENLVSESFSNSHLNLICYLNLQGDVVWGEVRESSTLQLLEMPRLFHRLQDGDPLVVHQSVDDTHKGVILTENGPMIVVSRPVISTRREGPVRGSLLMGRLLSTDELKGIAARTRVNLNAMVIGQDAVPEEFVLAQSTAPHQSIWLVPANEQALHAYQVVNDCYGQPLMIFRAVIPREISQQGAFAAQVATWSSVIGGLALVLCLWIMLKRQIVSPLRNLAQHAVRVGKLDDLSARLRFARRDEIGTLAREFDSMVERLAESRERIADSAHLAGMARIATDTLHNVGNALNSANCSLELLQERRRETGLSGLARAAGLLQEQDGRIGQFFSEDARGPQLAKFIVSLNTQLQQDLQADAVDLERLHEALHHIRDLVRAQQTCAAGKGFSQRVKVTGVCDGVLRLLEHELEAARVRVIRELADLPEAQLDKNTLSQVLLNFVKNAWQSLSVKANGERLLTIRTAREGDDGLRIDVEDNGMGFDQHVGERLFQHGFTTRTGGHGFGLHSCANAAAEMGGRVEANSPGQGCGATFSIVLPHVLAHEDVLVALA